MQGLLHGMYVCKFCCMERIQGLLHGTHARSVGHVNTNMIVLFVLLEQKENGYDNHNQFDPSTVEHLYEPAAGNFASHAWELGVALY